VGEPFQVCENSGQGTEVSPPNCAPSPDSIQSWYWAAPLVCAEEDAHFASWSLFSRYCVGGGNDGGPCTDGIDCPDGSCGSDGVIHLYHDGIVPSRMATPTGPIDMPAQYEVQVVNVQCDLSNESSYSVPLPVTQAGWGDVVRDVADCPNRAPNGNVNVIGDTISVINKFSNIGCPVEKARADIRGAPAFGINFKIDIFDILQTIAAFQGESYPFTPTDPCALGSAGREK
jgi:hypothetical protein